VRDPEATLDVRTAPLQLGQRAVEVTHPVVQNRCLPLQMASEQQARPMLGELQLRDARAQRFDGEDDFTAEDVPIEGEVASDITTRHVNEVEPLEGRAVSHGP
jgi:hypothetical protein